ncbi:DUF397 domain-containing protein [Phytohabitans aurantiacus]|uniref:DUF397 domain-containing protein n=1 Tax=Phytohabitans aurantiacus TaxID=3016789 RepID=A0ABQ5R148_9ACTN|nr:DUF397 domain-containing protein [Phytohabitans aurantiacus]GLI00420.1 hypothetical protein Pa4123_56960 [Phytohabitans aurantiacus]
MSQNILAWRKSRRCESNACVEWARTDEGVALRDSKDPHGPVLRFSSSEWTHFVADLKQSDESSR